MTHVLIIDNTQKIKGSWLGVENNVSLHDDEVQGLIAIENYLPSVILLNYQMRNEASCDYIKLILNCSPTSKIVLIDDKLNEQEQLKCLIAGAKGYQNIEQLADYAKKLVKVVDAGEIWITRQMVAKLVDRLMADVAPQTEFKPLLRLA